MLKLSLRIALLLPLVLVLVGCAVKAPPPPADEPKQTKAEDDDCCPHCAAKEKSQTDGCDGCDCEKAVSSDKEKARDQKVTLKSVKPKALLEAIGSHKGKVVVVDLWASFCGPCKREFPNFTKLHGTYAADGVVCISLSLDRPDDTGTALAFLEKQKATFANYHLDDEKGELAEKWSLESIPAVFVFGRDGKQAARFTNDDKTFTYDDDVVPLVRKLIKTK